MCARMPACMHVCVLQVLQLSFRIYMGQKRYHDAMRVALRLNEMPLIEQSFGGWHKTHAAVWDGLVPLRVALLQGSGRTPACMWGRRQGSASIWQQRCIHDITLAYSSTCWCVSSPCWRRQLLLTANMPIAPPSCCPRACLPAPLSCCSCCC